jgi:hypothetical protein
MKVRTKNCPFCHQSAELEVKEEDYTRWLQGDLIQRCFPYLSKDDRERLITGFHGDCWNEATNEH